MNDELIAAIQSFTLNTRALLERETEEQLQGLYGWLPDGSFCKGTAMSLPEAVETRARLEAFVAEEKDAGVDAAAAREKIKRETAFTWLNRAVAFRMMEERGILKSTLGKLHKSNAFIFWLTDIKGLANLPASTPVDALGEGPVDASYREFLLWQCTRLAAEVSVLFDPKTLASRFCPRPSVIKELVESMQTIEVADAWKAGNEEAIGWVYQGFSSQELQDAFAAAREDKKKFEPQDIPAVTQLFTIRWVVRFLVENTLGRIWVEMHPDSRLAGLLGYFVPPKHPQSRALRAAKEITFLDPSCGSMHFGLLAFDLFAEMYREERENAGKPGWPKTPSAATEEEIPELILAHNLHGIDIDMRAVQISALTLLLKARMLNPKARVTDQNLACANIEAFTGGRLDELIKAARFDNHSEEKILRALAARVPDSPHLGSLLRLERDLKTLVEAERKKLLSSSQPELLLAGLTDDLFQSTRDLESFFDKLAASIADRLDALTREAGSASQHTAAEASKGLRLLRLTEKRYDVVATNPPYLSGRKMNKRLAALMEQEYKEGKGDLYAAFIMRCQELLATEGLMGMLTMHSFMFISSYEDLRARLRKEVAIETLAHFGGGLFTVGNPGTLQTAAFVLRREPEAKKREGQVGTYFRLVKERDADTKRLAFESALAALRQGDEHHQLFHYQQSDFDAIPEKPLVYWMPSSIRKLFGKLDSIGDTAKPRVGLQTGHNERFMRKWWEVGYSAVDRNCPSRAQTAARGFKWFPYNKGGSPIPWASRQQNVVNWASDGLEIEAIKPKSVVRNPDYYFRAGVTWSLTTTKKFAARISPGGFIFDVNGMTCFPPDDSNLTVLGLLNSRAAQFTLSAISPTIAFQVGDIERLPVPKEHSSHTDDLVNKCVELSRANSVESETTYDFIQPPNSIADLTTRKDQLAALEVEIDAEVSRLYGLSEEDLAAIDRELNGPAASEGDDVTDDDGASGDEDDDEEAGGDLTPADWARSWISYALGTVLGRFEIGKPSGLGCGDFPEAAVAEIHKLIDADGIMPCDAAHPQDIAARTIACLELMLGATEVRERIRLATATEGDPVDALRGWLDRFTGQPAASFWKYHHQLYRKRPVYWPFQSPKKCFTIWVFHEKIGPNTLHTLKDLTDVRLNLLEREITDLRPSAATSRSKAKELDKLMDKADDLREFTARIKAHIDAGYESCIDDGVLLNAAPLHDLLPSWREAAKGVNDPKKAWEALAVGKFDWAHQAMRHWPERVTEACRTNRSFAIAHGLEHLCPADPPKKGKRKKQAALL
jgi:hypothetical protein